MLKTKEEEALNLQNEIELMQQKEEEISELHKTQLHKLEGLCNEYTTEIEQVSSLHSLSLG